MLSSAFVLFNFLIFGLEYCYCVQYNHFGIGDGANKFHALTNVKGQQNDIKRVSEYKSTNNKPTRGLFYPDDMFVTNWVPTVLKKEDCSSGRPSMNTPSSSKCTLKTKNNKKSTLKKEKLTLTESSPSNRSRSSTLTANNSSSSQRNTRRNSTRTPRKQTHSRQSLSKTPRNSTYLRRKSSKNQRKPTVAVDETFSKSVSLISENDEQHKLTTSIRRSQKPRSSTTTTTPQFFDFYADRED